MQKPQMPNIPGVAAMTDTLDFVKNLWGSMSVPGISIPGMAAPTLSVDELDKKIADLKAVESWLNVNVSMLRGTIQALEVQRGTIATLKSMGAALSNAVKQPGADEKSVLAAAPYASAFFAQPAVEPAPKVEAKPEPRIEASAAPTKGTSAEGPAPAMPNPAMWWNMLQDQFKQAVSTAMSSDAMANATSMAQDAAAKMAAASTGAAGKPEKPATKAAEAAEASPPVAKTQSAAAPAKRAAAKPAAGKPKAGKSTS